MISSIKIKILCSKKDEFLDKAFKKVFFERDSVEIKYSEDSNTFLEDYYLLKPDIILVNSYKFSNEVINYIRDQANDSDVYILVILDESELEKKEDLLNQGADDFLIRPFFCGEEEIVARLNVAKRHVILYKQLTIAYNRLSKEIDTVSILQQKLLPKSVVKFPGVFIDFFYEPSGRASGDYFDFFPVQESILRTVIADVSGHGSRAAFIMAMVRALARMSKKIYMPLDETVSIINNELIDVIGEDIDFVTLFAADIDIKEKKLSYINAGHCPGMLITNENYIELLEADFSVLGFFPQEFKIKDVPINNARGLLLVTDGYYEWNLDRDNIWGFDNFKKLLAEIFCKEKEFYLDMLEDYLNNCLELPPMYRDDRSALWLKFKNNKL
ncbi:SpoIIE family protein phosphatase [Desulfothermus okinawensis JCM 13304]